MNYGSITSTQIKIASMHWKYSGLPITQNFKAVPLAGNVVCLFWGGPQGVLLVYFQKPIETIITTSNYAVLRTLWGSVYRKRPGLLRRGLWLVQDDARRFAARATQESMRELKWERPDNSPYSPDLASSDFYLWGPLKDYLSVKRFYSGVAEVEHDFDYGFGYDSSCCTFTQLLFCKFVN